MRILVIDDSMAMRAIMMRTLKDLGFTDVSQCESSVDGLNRIRSEDWDLVILDWQMPQMTGLELLKQARGVFKKATPIIMVTVEQSRENVQTAIRCGADDYIIKPVSKELLMEKINRIRQKGKEPPQKK